MRTSSFLTLLAAATAMTAAPAMAQGDRDPANDFNGVYITLGGGYTAQDADNNGTLVFDTNRDGNYNDTVPTTVAGTGNAFTPGFCSGFATSNSPTTGCRGDDDEGEFFGRIGYDRRMGNFVLGGLVEGGKTYAKDFTTGFSGTPFSYTYERGIDFTVAARLRAGYTPNGGILFYATGGGVYANMKHRFYTPSAANSFTLQGDDDAWGYQAGGGVEALVTNHISIGLEYLYTDINDDDSYVAVRANGNTPVAGNPFTFGGGTNLRPGDQSFDTHSIRGTVSFRF